MNRTSFNAYIDRGDFTNMFVEMGWNHPDTSPLDELEIDEQAYSFKPVADKCGFHIYCCEVEAIPTQGICKKIDTHLRKYGYDYICIFREKDSTHDLWMVPVKNNEKRELVKTEYVGGAQADFLFFKIADFSFELMDHVLITDVKDKVQAAFRMNSETVTKKFYSQFRKEHDAFATFITGMGTKAQCEWYTSVMLNRLMFCYFIQKKGFLDNDTNYLSNKLDWVKKQQGEDQFYGSFYKGFLCALFHDGLNNPRHDTEAFKAIYGRIPYLNGGMFDVHQLEREHQDLDIADEAFERLFAFFDKWQWHLDTRLTAAGRDINPDVLGYIFEQYINDRAKMGAYYTKEDITEYIAKNCIIPFIAIRAARSTPEAFTTTGEVWTKLKNSGDKYIYDAVKKGYSPDWLNEIPDYIANGVDTTAPDLLARRARWNEKTDDPFALPTEIWRETVERFQRCDMLTAKIAAGEIHAINDFITYNLDIRQFIADIIAQTDNHRLVAHFYEAIKNITVLDPTCGSGAFLFAALNILEPLYEACLDRMEEFHAANKRLFKDELAEITDHYNSNREYFIYKSIILRNLYGVDIMIEATEIAKLRLFLKLVAVVEVNKNAPNLGLDPLPDIDFNIKCGNTLIGYTSTSEILNKAMAMDLFARSKYKTKIENDLPLVASVYRCFQQTQMRTYDDNASIAKTKAELKARLSALNSLFNEFLHESVAKKRNYEKWLNDAQPFHWCIEFYDIINTHRGFDVVIGNPPYVEYETKGRTGKSVSDLYKINGYETKECGNLYAYVMERMKSLTHQHSLIGMIVPLSGHSTERMAPLVKHFYNKYSMRHIVNLSADANPSTLFKGVKFRLSIFIVSNLFNGKFVTKYLKWYAEEREQLFNKHIVFEEDLSPDDSKKIAKIPSSLISSCFGKMRRHRPFFVGQIGQHICYYHNTPVHWIRAHSFVPYFCSERDGVGISSQLAKLNFNSKEDADLASSVLNSSLFYIWWVCNSDCYHLVKPEINNFHINEDTSLKAKISTIAAELYKDIISKSARRVYVYKTTGRVEYDEFYMKKSKSIIDLIDIELGKYFGFTEEELDHVINYDIKYRMGDDLENE